MKNILFTIFFLCIAFGTTHAQSDQDNPEQVDPLLQDLLIVKTQKIQAYQIVLNDVAEKTAAEKGKSNQGYLDALKTEYLEKIRLAELDFEINAKLVHNPDADVSVLRKEALAIQKKHKK